MSHMASMRFTRSRFFGSREPEHPVLAAEDAVADVPYDGRAARVSCSAARAAPPAPDF